jgi:hypothetical protein
MTNFCRTGFFIRGDVQEIRKSREKEKVVHYPMTSFLIKHTDFVYTP